MGSFYDHLQKIVTIGHSVAL